MSTITTLPSPAVARLSPAEERARLDTLRTSSPSLVLTASDLHMGPGRDPVTGVYDATENFFGDEAFARWLERDPAEVTATLLVLNGDIFDFVRLFAMPRTQADWEAWAARLETVGEHERAEQLRALARVGDAGRRRAARPLIRGSEWTYGLRTDDWKTVWKLDRILVGHAPVFDALARFVALGGAIIVTVGNHDVEIQWPLVHQALRADLIERGLAAGWLEPIGDGAERAAERIAFADGGFTLANVYFEHGHQYEPMTAVDGPAVLKSDPTQIAYPLGNFMNRFLINPIERLDPFLDNVKPVEDALIALLRKRPLRVLGGYVHAWRFLWEALKMQRPKGTLGPVLTVAAALFIPPIAVILVGLYFLEPAWFDWIPRWLRVGGSIAGISLPAILPYLLGVLGEIKDEIIPPGDDTWVVAARLAAIKAFQGDAPGGAGGPVPFPHHVTFGHTHQQTAVALAGGGLYVNSGTWIPLWDVDRPDLAGEIRHTYIRFERQPDGSYRPRPVLWDDDAGAARTPVMLGPPLF